LPRRQTERYKVTYNKERWGVVVGGAAEKANVRVGQRNVIIPTKENTTIGVLG
jgi:hypothetical protein